MPKGGGVYLSNALAEKYPNAATEWHWQYVHVLEQSGEGITSLLDTLPTDPEE